MDAVLKRHPYLIELVIDVTDAAWDRSNEVYESKFRKVIHEADLLIKSFADCFSMIF